MDLGHTRYEELAVGHVLGGLPERDASDFRAHLLDCRQCRRRVAELRDLASDLHAVEREERAALRVRTETGQADADVEPTTAPWLTRATVSPVFVAVLLAITLTVAFWNYHLRAQNDELVASTAAREEIVRALAEGDPAPVTFAEGITGLVVRHGPAISYSLAGLPVLDTNERLVVWLDGGDGMQVAAVLTPSEVQSGRVAAVIRDAQADRMVITVESAAVPATPRDDPLVDADLSTVPVSPTDD